MANEIGIVSYGCGNVRSVKNAVDYCGGDAVLVETPDELGKYRKLVLPGVGAFDHAMRILDERRFTEALRSWVDDEENRLLGICLGMQLLCNQSDESREHMQGLCMIDADVKQLKSDSETRLPSIGWSEAHFSKTESQHHSGDYYFLHSYGVFCKEPEAELAHSFYGETRFSSAITNGRNIVGYQFHPEKSHTRGLALLKDFCAP